jgi:hypothetical protein
LTTSGLAVRYFFAHAAGLATPLKRSVGRTISAMQPWQPDHIFRIFVAMWVVLGSLSFAFFTFNKNATLKRKVHAPLVVAVGVIFVGSVWLMGVPKHFLYTAIPAVALITMLNIRTTRFCGPCGRAVFSQNPFSRPEFCQKCGARLS